MPQSLPIFGHSQTQLPQDNEETKNQFVPTSETLSKSLKRFKNEVIISQEILGFYQLNPNLLSHTEISEYNRAVIFILIQKMRLWISENCHIRRLSYRTSSLACYILDLYFSKGNKCRLQEFHEFGICCLRIANKMEDNFLIPINYDIFSKDRLTQIEASICMKINFCLNPITFTEISHTLYHFWSLFKAEIRQFECKNPWNSFKKLEIEERTRTAEFEFAFALLHQFLQMVFLVLNNFKFGLDQLVSNAFYLTFCLQYDNYQKILTSSKILSFINKNQGLNKIWSLFGAFCQDLDSKLKFEINQECLQFLYPIYNCLITEGQTLRSPKDEEFLFDPNQERLKLAQGSFSQTLHFKNKMNSLKRYGKKQGEERLRKCSEVTHI